MAFDAQKPIEGKRLFTGLGDVSVEMVNPTLAELQAKGINFKEEPVYT